MASFLSSQGVVLATAVSVSGTVILLALRLQKSLSASAPHQLPVFRQMGPQSSQQALRPCISSDGKTRSDKKKKKKRVHFAEGVEDPIGYCEEVRSQLGIRNSNRTYNNSTTTSCSSSSFSSSSSSPPPPPPPLTASSTSNPSSKFKKSGLKVMGMPANRMALYSGIIRDHVINRLACSY